MNYLATMRDHQLNTDYDLYQINARVLADKLQKSYHLNPVRLQTFNEEFPLSEKVAELKGMLAGRINFFIRSDYNGLVAAKQECRKLVAQIKSNDHVTASKDLQAQFGYELMPFCVSVKDRDLNNEGIELVDGFRRIFFVKGVPDVDVLMKVYDTLGDTQFINSMVVFNSWKFKNSKSCHSYIDRGFRLGLYYRYRIHFINFCNYTHESIWDLIDIYTHRLPHASLWNNGQFHKDLVVINEIANYRPIFKSVKKNTVEVYDVSTKGVKNPHFLDKLIKEYIEFMGAIRRSGERKSLTLQRFVDYLAQECLQGHFIKMSKMSIPGFINNYFDSNLKDNMKSFIMGEELK